MQSFQYKHGDRPLEGYTIQRAAGRGGFGEVYYAISDAGREIALKVVQGYEQIELRGISQCMNLKNPHLVTIFDVRYNDKQRPFVIMEFVAGPSLRQLLDEAPSGLGTQKAAFFLREMGKGLTFLHDNGIVHRDLKPANVFYENGYVKIGDYGLSKLIAPTQHSAQTVTVGTVHYMAPEVGVGKYDRSIDIYALGAVLFEMITGMVPFNGATPSEILLKHLATEPDVGGIAEPFASVIKKAMHKDPAQRYQSVQEMVEAVFGAEHVRQSVSVFSPDELSVIAAHAAQRAAVGVGAAGGSSREQNAAPPRDSLDRFGALADRLTTRMAGFGDRVAGLGMRAAGKAGTTAPSSHTFAPVADDSLSRGQRKLLGVVTALSAGVAVAILSGGPRHDAAVLFPFGVMSVMGGAIGIHLAVRRLAPQLKQETGFARHLVMGGIAGVLAALFSFPFWAVWGMKSNETTGTWLGILVPLFCMNISAWTDADRPQRVGFWDSAFLAGLFGWIVGGSMDGDGRAAGIILAGISLTTQMLAPWDEKAASQRPVKAEADEAAEASGAASTTPPPVPGVWAPSDHWLPRSSAATTRRRRQYWSQPVPGFARVAFLVLFLLALAQGLFLVVVASNERGYGARTITLAAPLLFATLILFRQCMRRKFYGWWNYLIRPLLVMVLGAILVFFVTAAMTRSISGGPAWRMMAIQIFPAVAFITLFFIPGKHRLADEVSVAAPAVMPRRHARGIYLRTRLNLTPFAPLAAIAILAAFLLALSSALDIPRMLAAGLPNPSIAADLNSKVFPDYPDWPKLMLRLINTATVIAALIATFFLILARRRSNASHIIRGVIGNAGIVGAAVTLGAGFHSSVWYEVNGLIQGHRYATAVASMADAFHSGEAIASGVMFLVASILLAWPARQVETSFVTAPAPALAPTVAPPAPAPEPAPQEKGAIA